MVSSTPRPHFTPGKDPVPILQEVGWAPGPVWTGGKSRPHRDSIPDRPARSQSLYRLSYPAHHTTTATTTATTTTTTTTTTNNNINNNTLVPAMLIAVTISEPCSISLYRAASHLNSPVSSYNIYK